MAFGATVADDVSHIKIEPKDLGNFIREYIFNKLWGCNFLTILFPVERSLNTSEMIRHANNDLTWLAFCKSSLRAIKRATLGV